MEVQTQIQADLQIPEGTAVPVMQHDGLTRRLLVTLLSGGESWQPPEGVTAAVGYERPDRVRGLYDRMPDGTDAVSLEGNLASVLLPPRMLSAPGTVLACLVFRDERQNQLTTFPFRLLVQVNPAAQAPDEEAQDRLKWLEDKLEEYLTEARESGRFTGQTGPAPKLLGQEVAFQVSSDYRAIPTGAWQSQVPFPSSRTYVWSRTVAHYDSGDVVTYSVSRNGADGLGSVSSVCGVAANDQGNVALTAADVGALACVGGAIEGDIQMRGGRITGLAEPEAAADAATRAFSEAQAAAALEKARAYTDDFAETKAVSFLLTPASWKESTAPYTQTITISGLEAGQRLMVYPVYGTDQSGNLAIREAANLVSFAKRTDTALVFTCLEEKPGTAIPVTVEIYR
ncbi:MAG TPA: hypothetical protein DFH97_07090 [Clostridiales bacterium]|nr:hypothetical protein [Clostridiales bacterium]HCI64751.1 hypothetical protein [Clostridiales bacterium]